MRVLLLADRLGNEFALLAQRYPVALLPIAAKPVLEHVLEALTTVGITQAELIVSAHALAIEQLVEHGQRWGMQLHISLSQGEVNPALLLSEHATDAGWLAVRADCLITAPALKAFYQAAQTTAEPRYALQEGRVLLAAGPRLVDIAPVAWGQALPNTEHCESLSLHQARALTSIKHYWQANLDAVAGRLPDLTRLGREYALGLWLAPQALVDPRSLKRGMAVVGGYSQVHPHAELQGEVAISQRVIIDRGATLSDSVILPDSYIGQWLEVKQAIIAGNLLIRVDSGVQLQLHDELLLATLDSRVLHRHWQAGLERLLSVGLLLLSLPLWPLAIGLSYSNGAVWQTQRCLGNQQWPDEFGQLQRQYFTLYQFNTRSRVLNQLPALWAVIRGNLRLIGTSPRAQEPDEPWASVHQASERGVLGPAQFLPTSAPEEEREVTDAWFAANPSWKALVSHLWNRICR